MKKLVKDSCSVKSIIFRQLLLMGSMLIVFTACQDVKKETEIGDNDSEMVSAISNTLTEQEKQEGWKLLFDGETTQGWRKVYEDTFPENGWDIKEGMLTVLESDGRQGGGGGSIITEKKYSNFELRLDFKLAKGANSGIKYFVVEDPAYFKDSSDGPSGSGIGLEYQIIDDENWPDELHEDQTVGALYVLIPAAKDKKVNPVGTWNHVRLLSKGDHVEHWLNGMKVLEYQRGGDAFQALVDKSKYKKYKNFGLASKGHILLQDHGTRVSYRNIKIRNLD